MYRVLVVSRNPRNHEWLRDALERDFNLFTLADGPIEPQVICRATVDQRINLVILDVDLGDSDGLYVLRSLQWDAKMQDVPVIMVTCANLDSQTMMAFNNGAADCLKLPSSKLAIQARVRAACRRAGVSRQERGGRLVAFIGAKGGVGTTTVAVNTGISLVERGLQVTIVDLRGFFGTMAAHLGVYPHEHPHNLAELLDDGPDAIDSESVGELLIHHSSGMRALLGAQAGDGYHRITEEQAAALVTSLLGHADYTIFDLPPCPTDAVEVVLKNCEQVLLVLEREPAAVQAARVLFRTLVSDGVVHGDIAAVVVHQAAVASPIPIEYLQKEIGCPIVAMIPPASDGCAAAARSREPLIKFCHDSDCAESLEHLANKLTEQHLAELAF